MTLKYLTEPKLFWSGRGPPCHWDWVPMAPPNFRASLPGTQSPVELCGAMMITPCSWDVFGYIYNMCIYIYYVYIYILYVYIICMVTPPWSTWKHFRWELSCVDSIEPPGRGHCWEYCIPVEFLQFGACFSPLCQITYGPFGSYKML